MSALSVVIVASDRYAMIRKTVRHLSAQSIADQIELVIVSPSVQALELVESDLTRFAGFQSIEVGPFVSLAIPRAAGVRASTAPIVALAEDHCFPRPDWAAALVRAHDGPWVAVGPALENANPGLVSWAQMFLTYGRWVAPGKSGIVEDLPGHNSSYKRAALLEYGSSLAAMLEVEPYMHADLRARGHRLYFESAARTAHLNINRFQSFLVEHVMLGQKFAATRRANWSWLRRLAYIVATPLVGPVQHTRAALVNMVRSGVDRGLMLRTWPLLLVGGLARSIGEMRGLAFGVGRSATDAIGFEVHRYRHLTATDRRKYEPLEAD
jgi:Glycosyl transferase family 2